ncbi:lasso peptide biosynthesis B2 protein [Synechococcales cyanobacterium C]|uniref:Lasso peptide biosynthesis B2 protein n=1 Tax=Petrachloros mirabilis ULC683 TaxID=2781853 RepID=A0A8K2A1F1_9CYAN|nr:lasso peptide biosynthesis B2 protein [Petrachloros mirabilis]NCJ08052.1 lasso peptide biosynthesis B2 protein [Petrachloros mirabilis ULC683]
MWLEAWLWLGLARSLILTVPFKHIAPHLGTHRAESSLSLSPEEAIVAREVSQAIWRAARNTPWKSNCLAQAIAAKRMLQRRGVSSTLYLGVNKDAAGELAAHAWVRCGEFWLTGGRGELHYTVVSTFTEE